MTAEIEAFRARLKAAGQPWQSRGVRTVTVGVLVLVVAQVVRMWTPLLFWALLTLGAAVLLMAAGWAFLIVAFVRRNRWVKAHAAEAPPGFPGLP
jgi:hypothetical protein